MGGLLRFSFYPLGMRGPGVYGTRGDRSEDKQVEGELGRVTWGGDSSQR